MPFYSILFEQENRPEEPTEAPDFFVDLNLDQIVDAIVIGRQKYNLKPFFFIPLHDSEAITYRHEIMRDLEDEAVFHCIDTFSQYIRDMHTYLQQAEKLYYTYQKKRWFLDAVEIYCDAVTQLQHDLSHVELHSRGLLAFRAYVTDYAHSEAFTSLQTETKQLQADLASIHYMLRIKGSTITVLRYEEEPDYSAQVEETFAKFKQGAAKDYRVKFSEWKDMSHVEARILELVAKLYPDIFQHLDAYCTQHEHYLDDTLATFEREVQFYLAYLEYIARIKRTGLPYCYPRLCETSKDIYAYEAFDLALAYKLMNEQAPVVCNDFFLKGKERILVVTGPNQGGKTTFARMFGQLHYLASLGCPVQGREAQLFLYDRLFTHFEKEETIANLRGKLQDDLVRMRRILDQATSRSILIMNEVFTSTTVDDALFLSRKIMERIVHLDALCVWVTFLDELASFSEQTVSMTSTVVPDQPAVRTYKIVRRPADGLAYALAIAEKYRLTYERLKERLTS